MVDPALTTEERELVRQCTTSTDVCDDMEMSVHAVIGCADAEKGGTTTFCTIDSATSFPPPLTVIGKGFGFTGMRMWVGPHECNSVAASNYTNGDRSDPTFYIQLICTEWQMSGAFSELITVKTMFGSNVTGPAGVHFGPPVIDSITFNDSHSCRDTGSDSRLHLTCWDDVEVTFEGRHFPMQTVDYPSTFLSGTQNSVPSTFDLGLMLTAGNAKTGPPCLNLVAYTVEEAGGVLRSFVKCDLIIRALGEERARDRSGVYNVRLWWGALWGTGNVTVTIPPELGSLRSVSCGDYVFPEYTGPEAFMNTEKFLSMAGDSAYIASVPLECSVGVDQKIHVECCNAGGVGQSSSDCTYFATFATAAAHCRARGLYMCGKEELLRGEGAASVSGCTTAGRRSWVKNEACHNVGLCQYSRPFTFKGKWLTNDFADYDAVIYAIDSAQHTGIGNHTCEIRKIAYIADPESSSNERLQEVTCEPRGLSRNGRYAVALTVGGQPYDIPARFEYRVQPEVTRISGCYDLGLSTLKCPSFGAKNAFSETRAVQGKQSPEVVEKLFGRDFDVNWFANSLSGNVVVYIHGHNFDHVTDVSFAGRFCNMNRTADVTTVVTPNLISCVIRADMTGITSRARLHIMEDAFDSPTYVTATWSLRPRVDSASCTYIIDTRTDPHIGRCPTHAGQLTVFGEGFDTIIWQTPNEQEYATGSLFPTPTLLIGNVECDKLTVVNSTMAVCEEYDIRGRFPDLHHQVDPALTISFRIGSERDPYGVQHVFRRVPFITAVHGCENYCDYTSQQPITVVGGNFTQSDTIYVHIGGVRCIQQVYVDSQTLICEQYERDMTLKRHKIEVQMNGEWSAERFSVEIIALCNGANGLPCSGHGACTHHADCICQYSKQTGFWVGTYCDECELGYWGPDCKHDCVCPGTGICDHGVNGTGFCGSCSGNYSGILCDPCPGTLEGLTCGLHGTCNDTVAGDGMCTCDSHHWDPLTGCFACDENYYGPACLGACPGGARCSGHGVCDNGLGGSGACSCDAAWGGASCDSMCGGGVGNTCFGHGTCDVTVGACRCFFDGTDGHWAEPSCSSCAVGWTGSKCVASCAVASDGLECSGHGYCGERGCVCSGGFCSFDCSRTTTECSLAVCLTDTTWGNEQTCGNGICGCDCPKHENKICSSQGVCDAGEYGTGMCNCYVGRSGKACEYDCSSCSIEGGVCDELGVCYCNTGYAGPNCDRACPGAKNGVPCGGSARGSCSGGEQGTGLCTCLLGYAGTECLTQCAGGADNPCSGHGTCSDVDGTCTCTTSRWDGYWGGTTCDTCLSPFLLPTCNETCPGYIPSSSVTCSGHGICNSNTRRCVCQVEKTGSWFGVQCDECSPGFFGASCDLECPGGACNPCNGHGICNDGILGDGSCSCERSAINGNWGGAMCDQCVHNFYGATCKNACPGLFTQEGICKGRGYCTDGRTGTGECICQVPGEKWTGSECNLCQAGYYGPHCDKGCPSTNAFICSGHGSCADGTGGFGNCSCTTGWVDSSCSSACPGLGTVEGICHQHGDCIAAVNGGSECVCNGDAALGFWKPPSCSSCAVGYFGAACTEHCPGSNQPCSGRGVTASCDVVTGECKCQSGWAGQGCDVECAGGSVTPCSMHGFCNPVSGKCTCHSSPTLGYWSGATCSACHPHYTSAATGCIHACPLEAPCQGCSPLACSGYGQCTPSLTGPGAVCIMCSDQLNTRCGDACEIRGDTNCQRYMCAGARWGLQCDNLCPGATPALPFPCSSHGFCDEGKAGSGRCICDSGYVGDTCELRCPECTAGRGTCATDGTCTCLPGFGGTLCDKECPGGFRVPCGMYDIPTQTYQSHGTCNDGSSGDVSCTCNIGWRGVDCNTPCPGILPDGTPCMGNGDCIQLNPRCRCRQDAVNGFWSGDACTGCSPGYVGENCTQPCTNGVTSGKTCRCDAGYYGTTCVDECPGKVSTGTVSYCNGHGVCDEGFTGTGACTCSPEYAGDTCETYCVVEVTCQEYLKQAVICGKTGCECIQNATHGYWQGSSCEECVRGYWGPSCLQRCDCNGNEYTCDQQNGDCACYADAVSGFYTGAHCQACKTGYIGPRCQTVDVKISRPAVPTSTAPQDMVFRNQDTAFILEDEEKARVIVATTPPVVFDISGSAPVYSDTLSKGLQFITARVTGGHVKTFTVNLLIQQGEVVDMYVFHRTNFTLKTKIHVVLPRQALRDQLATKGRSANILSSQFGSRRRHWEVLQASPAAAFGTLQKAVSIGTMWAMVLQYPSEVKLRIVSTESGRSAILHEQILNNFDTFAGLFVLNSNQLIISGSLSGSYDITALELDSNTGVVRSALSFKNIPDLSAIRPRSFTGRFRYEMVQADGTNWFIAFRKDNALYLLKLSSVALFDTPPGVNPFDCTAGTSCGKVLENTGNWAVNKMVIDRNAGEGYITVLPDMHDTTIPSQMFRFNLATAGISGSMKLTFFAGKAEVAQDILVLGKASSVVTLPATGSVRLITLNTYFVEKLIPDVADMRGGAKITVVGRGFRGASVVGAEPLCRAQGQMLPVLSYNQTTVVCQSLPTLKTSSCEGEPVDISFQGPDRFTSNDNAKLRRVFAATLERSYPSKGALTGGAEVTIEGYGFDYGGYLTCEFFDPHFSVTTLATYRKSTEIACIQPPWPRPSIKGQSYVRVSQEGQVPSMLKIPYDVVGGITSLQITDMNQAGPIRVQSEAITILPALLVDALDESGQIIYPLLTQDLVITPRRTVHCISEHGAVKLELLHNTASKFLHITSNMPQVNLAEGRCSVDGLYFKSPVSSKCALTFEVYSALPGIAINDGALFEVSASFEIVAGKASKLMFLEEPAALFEVGKALSPSPVVELLDTAGNKVWMADLVLKMEILSDTPLLAANVNLTTNQTVLYFKANPFTGFYECTCERIIIPNPIFGVTYHLAFTAFSSTVTLPTLSSNQMTRQKCPTTHYALLFSPQCLPCPSGGVCDGSWRIDIADGYWRWQGPFNYSNMPETDEGSRAMALQTYTTLYECNPSSACGSGNGIPSEDVVCGVGHDDAARLCADCVEGYALSGTRCAECPGSSVTLLISLLIVSAAVVIIGSVVFMTYIDNVKGVRSDGFVVMKQVFSWLQTIAVSSQGDQTQNWPETFGFYEVVRKSFNLHSEVGVFNCLMKTTYYEKWLFVMLLPFITTVAFWIVAMILQVLDLMKERENNVPEKSTTLNTDITFIDNDFEEIAHVGLQPKTKEIVTDIVGFLLQGNGGTAEGDFAAVTGRGRDAEKQDTNRTFMVPQYPDLYKGTHSELLMSISTPPPTDVSLMPYGPGLTFVPPVFSFTRDVTEIPFSIVGNVLGSHRITYKVSGSDKRMYPPPKPQGVTIFDQWRTGVHDKVISTLVVFFFFCLPIFADVMARLIPCQQIGPEKHYLIVDPNIECYTNQYWRYWTGNVVVILVYCVCIPVVGLYFTYRNRDSLETPEVRVKMGFLFRGMKPKLWYWEFIVMFRKLAITLICSLSTDLWSRIYAVQWIVALFLGLTAYFKPYVARANNYTELLLLLQLIVTTNVSLIYFTKDLSPLVHDAAGVVVVISNVGTVLAVIVAFIWIWKMNFVLKNRHKRFQKVMTEGGEDDAFEKEENTTWVVFFRSMLRRHAPRLIPCLQNTKRVLLRRKRPQQKPRPGLACIRLVSAVLPIREQDIMERSHDDKAFGDALIECMRQSKEEARKAEEQAALEAASAEKVEPEVFANLKIAVDATEAPQDLPKRPTHDNIDTDVQHSDSVLVSERTDDDSAEICIKGSAGSANNSRCSSPMSSASSRPNSAGGFSSGRPNSANRPGSANTRPGSANTRPSSAKNRPGSANRGSVNRPTSGSSRPGSAKNRPGSATKNLGGRAEPGFASLQRQGSMSQSPVVLTPQEVVDAPLRRVSLSPQREGSSTFHPLRRSSSTNQNITSNYISALGGEEKPAPTRPVVRNAMSRRTDLQQQFGQQQQQSSRPSAASRQRGGSTAVPPSPKAQK